jgi:hypothetical protein
LLNLFLYQIVFDFLNSVMSTGGRREECTGCWWGNLRERGHWGDPDVDVRIILRWIFRKLEWSVTQDRDRWRALVSTVMNLRVA